MKIQFGALVTGMSGKFGGMTFGHNSDGAYIRRTGTQVVPRTVNQSNPKNLFTQAVTSWRSLTDAQRLQWQTSAGQFKTASSGFRLYVKIYLQYAHAGKTVISVPPSPSDSFKVTACSIAFDRGTTKMEITLTPAIPAGKYVMIYATPPLSLGITTSRKGLRLITVLDEHSASPYNAWTDYENTFGATPATSQCTFVYTSGVPGSLGRGFWPGRATAITWGGSSGGMMNDTANKVR